jgi:hypothetical protein
MSPLAAYKVTREKERDFVIFILKARFGKEAGVKYIP